MSNSTSTDDRRGFPTCDEGGDPACWAHLFDDAHDDATLTEARDGTDRGTGTTDGSVVVDELIRSPGPRSRPCARESGSRRRRRATRRASGCVSPRTAMLHVVGRLTRRERRGAASCDVVGAGLRVRERMAGNCDGVPIDGDRLVGRPESESGTSSETVPASPSATEPTPGTTVGGAGPAAGTSRGRPVREPIGEPRLDLRQGAGEDVAVSRAGDFEVVGDLTVAAQPAKRSRVRCGTTVVSAVPCTTNSGASTRNRPTSFAVAREFAGSVTSRIVCVEPVERNSQEGGGDLVRGSRSGSPTRRGPRPASRSRSGRSRGARSRRRRAPWRRRRG